MQRGAKAGNLKAVLETRFLGCFTQAAQGVGIGFGNFFKNSPESASAMKVCLPIALDQPGTGGHF